MAKGEEEETAMTDAEENAEESNEEEEAVVPSFEEEEATFLNEELSFCLIDNFGDDLPYIPYYESTGNQNAERTHAAAQINAQLCALGQYELVDILSLGELTQIAMLLAYAST